MSEKNDEFELFWKACLEQYKRAGSNPGSKQQAFLAYSRTKNKPELRDLVKILTLQASAKIGRRAQNLFSEDFQHVCRWLKYRRWEDVIDAPQSPHPPNPAQPFGVDQKLQAEINYRRQLCYAARAEYYNALKAGDEKLAELLKLDFEAAVARFRELCPR